MRAIFGIRCLLVTACLVGAASYQRCCSESYRKSSRLGASARASAIDACMNRKPGKAKKKG